MIAGKNDPTAGGVEIPKRYLEEPEYTMLIRLKVSNVYSDYDDPWGQIEDDLRNRLAGKPYRKQVGDRIDDDIGRIEDMREFENTHGINLADHLPQDSGNGE
jgi:hypothetical protein